MINPSKLKTLVDDHAAGPAGMAAMGVTDDDTDAEDDGEGDEEIADPAEHGKELLAGWGEFGAALLESADLIVANAHEVGADLLAEPPSEDAMDKVGDTVDRMPEDLQDGFGEQVAAASPEDCYAVASALVGAAGEPGDEDDYKLICAYLTAAAKWASDTGTDEGDDEDEDEDDEEDMVPVDGADPAA